MVKANVVFIIWDETDCVLHFFCTFTIRPQWENAAVFTATGNI